MSRLTDKLQLQQKKKEAKEKKNHYNSNNYQQGEAINRLSKTELTFLMTMIKNANFKGESIELLYNLVLKLQDKYFRIENTKEED